MHTIPRKSTHTVRLLTDPEPAFVSLVSHAATQNPFTALKSVTRRGASPAPTGAKTMPIAQRNTTTSKQAPKKPAAKTVDQTKKSGIRKMVFDGGEFPSQESVLKFLMDNGYANYQITKDGNDWTVASKGVEDDHFVSTKAVTDAIPGVTAHIGFYTEKGRQFAETAEKAAKSAANADEMILKFDWYNAYISKGQTVKQVLEDGMSDGVPPGVDAVITASATAVGNILAGEDDLATKRNKIKQVGTEMSDIISAVSEVYDAALGDENAQKSDKVKKFVEDTKKALEKLAKSEEEPAVDPTKKADDKEKKEKTEAEPPAAQTDADKMADAITKALGTALKPLSDTVASLGTQLTAVKETAEKAATAAKALGDKAPTKKGEGDDEDDAAPAVVAGASERILRGNLGLRERSRSQNRAN
jgi:hypothetical protein